MTLTTTDIDQKAAPGVRGPEVLTAMDPVFAQMGTATIAHASAVPGLTEREKVFLSVTSDVCHQNLGLIFELHLRKGLAEGVSTMDIRALLRLIAYDSGYPAALAALERLTGIEKAGGLPGPAAEELSAGLLAPEYVSTGPEAAPSPLPEQVRETLRDLDPHFTEHFDLQSRMRSGTGPGTLSIRERAFTTMSIDVHYQTLDETFRIHANRALGAGASRDDLRAVLRYLAPFGMTKAWQAWKALNAFFVELDEQA